jgi:hypothetical protein
MSRAAFDSLCALLRGQARGVDALANAVRVEALGHCTFGRTDALDLFAGHPVVLSPDAHVLSCPAGFAALDTDADGNTHGVFAELCGSVVNRVWLVGAVSSEAATEPAVGVASDDFMTQLREPVHGEAMDHPALAGAHWPHVIALGQEALAAVRDPAAASSSHAVVLRAFSDGNGFAALYALRLQTTVGPGGPRAAHHRWALSACRVDGEDVLLHRRLAVSQAWPVPAPVSF